ncbi:hypothetical protein [Hymenobacter weizhouensis]|uniref:hypothetical protein n=1 Tax=Hymenobacter sp. YIM 151500-1 TaxID=2987689 RepID=UPI002226FBE0|nr:hypothetical protein [Hymenobacter sp. YIM 151500-1]UYZ64486.1 hypothetical protein OIS53_06455 [Hymenobacter sp. YIM 151500-1]
MRFSSLHGLLTGGLLALATACQHDGTPFPGGGPASITFRQTGIYPEGVQYDALRRRYFVSSVTRGVIGQVRDDGSYAPFADDPRLISSIGLHLDILRNRLLAAVSDLGVGARTTPATAGQLAALASFDARTGQRTGYLDLGALRPGQDHFANDVAVDLQGNAYVTDSFSPIIYKVTVQGQASVFYENNSLDAPAGGFGFNGIVFHPAGYLLVNHTARGVVYKIPLGGPEAPTATPVATAQSLVGADGMLLQDPRTLLVVSGAQSTVFRLASTDGFATARVTGTFATGPTFPTTLTRRSPDAYVLYAYLGDLFSGQPPRAEFSINKVRFESVSTK